MNKFTAFLRETLRAMARDPFDRYGVRAEVAKLRRREAYLEEQLVLARATNTHLVDVIATRTADELAERILNVLDDAAEQGGGTDG